MKTKSLLALLLALALCVSGMTMAAAEEEAPAGYQLGDKIADFSFTGYDGVEHTLYELLEEKQMVLLNFWATWCGPCRSEFPMMDAAYQNYKDKIEIVALSVEEGDTLDVVKDFAAQNGMSFIVGRDETNLFGTGFYTGAIPTSVVIDRFGTVCFFEAGSVTSQDAFERLFDTFVGDDYTESVLLPDGIPAKIPDVAAADPADLAAAVGSEGVTFVNPTDEYNWPMVIAKDDTQDYIVSTNKEQGNSVSSVEAHFTAAEGDVLTLDYKLSTESGYDFLTVTVNGETVKRLSGERDWKTFAYALPAAGDYTVVLAYEKDPASDSGDDAVCIDNVAVLTGDAAAAALAAMPVYPFAEATTVTVTTEGAKKLTIEDSTGLLARNFGDADYYVIPGDTATFAVTLAEGSDPDAAVTYSYFDGSSFVLADCVKDDHYEFSSGIDSMATTGASYCYVTVTVGDAETYVVFFNTEDDLNTFFTRNLTNEDGTPAATWEYAE